MFGSDPLANVFLFVFLFGLVFTSASLILGFSHAGGLHGPHLSGTHGHMHIGPIHIGHAHVGGGNAHTGGAHIGHVAHPSYHDGGHDLHIHTGDHDGPGFLNMPTMMAFITWFGGVGYIFRQQFGFSGFFAVTIALVSGFVGGWVMFTLLARWLWPMMSEPMKSSDYSLPGTPAKVVSPIRAGGVGEIVYTKQGVRCTAGARSISDEEAIPRGAEVVILHYERGLTYVQDVHAALNRDAAPYIQTENSR